ncbi:MAG: hypothetical protein K2X82_31665, partial [Gemmataceae bacterium]|nr:hypothetical protein [Gemmataceae bacterium]
RPGARAFAAQARRTLGALLSSTGRTAEARAEFARAADAFDRLAAEFPADRSYPFQAALARNNAGYNHFLAGEFEAAEAADRAAADRLGELVAADPGNPLYRAERARALQNLFAVLRRTNRPADAVRAIDEAAALLRSAAADRRDPRDQADLGNVLQSRAAVHSDRGEWARAEPFLREAAAVQAALAADYPAVPDYRHEQAKTQSNLAVLYFQLDRPAPAAVAFREAAAAALRLADDFPGRVEYRLLLGQARTNLGLALLDGGPNPAGEAALAEALPVWEKLHADAPGSPAHLVGLVNVLAQLGRMADLRNDHAKARGYLERAERLRAGAPGLMTRDPLGRAVEQVLATYLPRALVGLGDHAAAAPLADELAAITDIDGPDNAFNAGCYLARCAGLAAKDPAVPEDKRAALADDYAKRAVAHLRTAAARGFKPVKQFAADTDLVPLRGRPDYQDFLAGLK